ncbi:MAG: bifunctional glutamate N-acetyltransferase/amino-acid acetyltransferase ArgJ [Pseudomonadales bacterium]|nr:bifunctional glutamate N-acetyltransferase/amino-acid acetyltransferase ArgJ [Pseudomonadales bacterium]
MAVGPNSTAFNVVPGVRLASMACGIKKNATDLVMFEFAEGSNTAGVFTQSVFAAAPVEVGRRHLQLAQSRYFVINSGNANAAMGEQGISDAVTSCQATSQLTGTRPEAILPFSTGVIGERLPVEKITDALGTIIGKLDENNWLEAAHGIMTTDTRPKIATRQVEINGQLVTMTGIAKGAGMIQPNMATMLAYIATDAVVEQALLQQMLTAAVNRSFNRITVDSDTSTNDSCMLTATGRSGVSIIEGTEAATQFDDMLTEVCCELAQGIIRDGEGATKFVEVRVENAARPEDALSIAYAIANSPLIKTALYASDANWGRIVMAIGKAGVALDVNKLDVAVGDVMLMIAGQKHPDYTEQKGAAVMQGEEILIRVNLNAGSSTETVWTSDLSHDYVTINAEYRT